MLLVIKLELIEEIQFRAINSMHSPFANVSFDCSKHLMPHYVYVRANDFHFSKKSILINTQTINKCLSPVELSITYPAMVCKI